MDPNVPAPDSIDQAPTGIDPQQLLHFLAAGPMNIARHTSNILNQGDLLPSQWPIDVGAEAAQLGLGSTMPGVPEGALGAGIGGTGWRYLTASQKEALMALNKNAPATIDDAKNMLHDLGVKYRINTPKGPEGTTYIRMKDPLGKRPGAPDPQIRFPGDAEQHIGRPRWDELPGDFIDTGVGIPRGVADLHPGVSFIKEPGTILNQGGGSLGTLENLKRVLDWRFPGAPRNEQWLVPEEFAPMKSPQVNVTPLQPKPDPNQRSFMQELLKSLVSKGLKPSGP